MNDGAVSSSSSEVHFETHGYLSTVKATAVRDKKMNASLPPECEGSKYPVCLLVGAYNPREVTKDNVATFFEDLEGDLLIECCKFGKIVRIHSPESKEFEGCVAITFYTAEAAEMCAADLHGRWFGGQQLRVDISYPSSEKPIDIVKIQTGNLGTEFVSVALVRLSFYCSPNRGRGGNCHICFGCRRC
jgi:hypothetical protein